MNEARRKRRANRIAVGPKDRSARSPSSDRVQSPPSASPLPAPQPVFSGRALWVSLALIAINVAVYAPVRRFEFVTWDDPQYVYDNPHVSGGLNWNSVTWAFTTGYQFYWHPLTWLSHMLDVQVYGLNAGPHHVTNLLLHIVNTVLLFGLLHWMTGALGRSAFVAALFAIHPLRVESVAWVAERKDVLSTLFWMLTVWAYVAYARRPRLGRYLLVLVFFALGLMAKPMLVTLPFALLLLDFWPLDRGGQRSVWLQLAREKVPMLALAAGSSIVTFATQAGAVAGLDALPLRFRAANAVVSYLAYIGKMLWPTRLAAFYPYRAVPGWWVAGAILILIGVSAMVIRTARRHPYLPVGWLWYMGTLLPVIGLIQAGGQSWADRFTYVPLIGLFIMVAWGIPDLLAHWPYRSIALPAAAGLVICACAITARAQVQYWKSSLSLWGRAVEVTTGNYRAHNHLGVALSDQGKAEEAIAHYSEALRIWPDFAEAHINLAVALAEKGNVDEAIDHYVTALRIKPYSADAHNDLAAALESKGRVDEAIHELSEAVRIKPDDPTFHYNLGIMYGEKGNSTEAVAQLKTALALNPGYQDARRALADPTSRRKNHGPPAQ